MAITNHHNNAQMVHRVRDLTATVAAHTAALDAKSARGHGHALADVTGLPEALAAAGGGTATDYTEGTWSVGLTSGSTQPQYTMSSTSGNYIRIRNMVHFQFYSGSVQFTSPGTGGARINLPFPAYSIQPFSYLDAGIFTGDSGPAYCTTGQTFVQFTSPSLGVVDWTTSTDVKYIMIAGVYRAQ